MLIRKFVISDIHGKYDMLLDLLKHWDSETEQLVLLGDYIDRGEDSKKVLELIYHLRKEHDVVLLKGNHEDMLLQWLDHPDDLANHYLPQGGRDTLDSFNIGWEYTHQQKSLIFQHEHPEILKLLNDLNYYYEDEDHIFVHAGINPFVDELEDMNPVDFLWIRNKFIHTFRPGGKRVIFGHTPTRRLNKNEKDSIWVSEEKQNIGIDGGAVFGGNLIGLRIHSAGYQVINISSENKIKKEEYNNELEKIGEKANRYLGN